jgi:DNA/RNA-binding domain of Phe-tRNA-synthetase-like protein
MTSTNSPELFTCTNEWRERWPGASAGVMFVRRVRSPQSHPELDRVLEDTESRLRARYGGMERAEIRETGNLAHYHRYYRSFGQNYHVQHQIESIAQKGKTIPRRTALVEAAFRSELENGLLTGVHDLDELSLPVVLDVGDGERSYIAYNGSEVTIKPGDMYYRDQADVLSSIILGPSKHARVTPETTAIAVVVYGPPGIQAHDIESHLTGIWTDVRLFSPDAELAGIQTASA